MAKKEFKDMYVATVSLSNEDWVDEKLSPIFKALQGLYNAGIAEIKNRISLMEANPEYIKLCKEYSILSDELKNIKDDKSKEYKNIEKKKNEIGKAIGNFRKEMGFKDAHSIQTNILVPIKQSNVEYDKISSPGYSQICDQLFRVVNEYLYGKKNSEIRFKQFNKGEYVAIYGGSRNRSTDKNTFNGVGIVLDSITNILYAEITFNQKPIFVPITTYTDGRYFWNALSKATGIPCALSNEGIRSFIQMLRQDIQNKINACELGFNISHKRYMRLPYLVIGECNLILKEIRGKKRYYLNITFDGLAPRKFGLNSIENAATNVVGIDIGTQSIVLCYRHADGEVFKVEAFELSESVDNDLMHKISDYNRSLEHKRRINNLGNYNADGTISKGQKEWKSSRNYKETLSEYRTLNRNKTEYNKVSHSQLVKHILNYAHNVIIEPMDYPALAKRAKETTYKEVEVNGEIHKRANKKARYGKSVLKKSPASFMNMLEQGVKEVGGTYTKVSKYGTKASQYNHITNTFVKKDRNTRYNYLTYDDKEKIIQRDMYSAFLLSNVLNGVDIDRQACLKGFDSFVPLHDELLQSLLKKKKEGTLTEGLKNIL